MTDVAEKLANLRGEKTQREVAEAIGVSTSTWSMYENGERVPRDGVKIKIAKYFGVSIGDIFYPNVH